ncbi:MAG: hemolysin III family protein [Pseudomonadota bacterium]
MLPLKPTHIPKGYYSDKEELFNVLSHSIGFLLSVIGCIALLIKSQGLNQIIATAVYGFSLSFMFLSSSVYHASTLPKVRNALRKVDHTAIYLLIAGSYTPLLAFTLDGLLSTIALVAIWLIGLFGVIFKLLAGAKYPKVSISSYAIMGWFAILLIYPIYQNLSLAGFTLMLAGGICYSAGIPFYLLKSRHYSHALWHIAVLLGAICHFFTIYWFVL